MKSRRLMILLYSFSIVGTPLIKWGGGGVGPSKIESLGGEGGGAKPFARKGDKPEKVGLMKKWGDCHFFYSLTTFTVCEGKVRFPLLLFGSLVFQVSHARFSSNSLLY